MSFTPTAAPYKASDNLTAGSNTVSLQDYAHDEIVNKVSELDDQTTAQAESIAKNVQDIAANAENIAANTADITELKSNNYLVEIKDTVTENTNYETHDFKETSSDGTENQVSNFVLAAKQITGISVDADAASMTINTVNQTGAAESETLTLPAGGGTAYDDTQVKADIATNTANIATNTANIATNTANIATNTNDIADLKESSGKLTVTLLGDAISSACTIPEGTKLLNIAVQFSSDIYLGNTINLSILTQTSRIYAFVDANYYAILTYNPTTKEITTPTAVGVSHTYITSIS